MVMRPPIHKATFIIRLWTDTDPADPDAWRGTAEQIGGGLSHQFKTLDKLYDWLRHELEQTPRPPQDDKTANS
jgi:hypothetical protein